MSNWRHTTIGALGRVVTGKTPQTSHPEYYGGDIPFITPSDMEQRYALDVSRKLSNAGARSVKNCILPAYSVAVSCIGSDMGKSVMTDRPSVTNQQLNAIIVNNENDPHFVYYLTSSMRAIFKINAQGSTALPILNKGNFANIKVQVPDLPTQKILAGALSALDSKIEHNNELIKMLEEQAQLVYDYWFMQFDFPDENGKPYRSSGGKMEWCEELKREIPEEWSVERLDSLCFINSDTYKEREKWEVVRYLDTSNLTENRIDNIETIRLVEDKLPSRARRKVKDEDILFSTVRPNQLHYGLIIDPEPNLLVSTGFAVLTAKKECVSPYLVYEMVTSAPVVNALQKKAELATSAYPSIRPEQLAEIQIPVPPPDSNIMQAYDALIRPLYRSIDAHLKENIELAAQRDFLLPLLMSGQVKVAERGVKESDKGIPR